MIKFALIFLLALAAVSQDTAEKHFYYAMPLRAKLIEGLNLPGDEAVRDVLMINVRLQKPRETFRMRVWLTVKLPTGTEAIYERRIDVRPDDLWATCAYAEPQILDSEFVRIRIKEEPEPEAIAESTSEVK